MSTGQESPSFGWRGCQQGGWISGPEYKTALHAVGVFTIATLVSAQADLVAAA